MPTSSAIEHDAIQHRILAKAIDPMHVSSNVACGMESRNGLAFLVHDHKAHTSVQTTNATTTRWNKKCLCHSGAENVLGTMPVLQHNRARCTPAANCCAGGCSHARLQQRRLRRQVAEWHLVRGKALRLRPMDSGWLSFKGPLARATAWPRGQSAWLARERQRDRYGQPGAPTAPGKSSGKSP